ncbi:serine/threonine protein kinase [Stappia taiwanensis]|uniref:Serine/threonine protein kinase n=1 Tax=Stappia taiwanensis TaxID=992267 RepID=A0A838Y3K4_9HYPH|nr:serine/threonine protein kinase [Stappia taiwanensis]MBA4613440.1 serine/threonine protein kinase [Stappia taiwanensis]GGF02330.1 HPr kinase [Stappia taiwanensis]
MRPTVHASCVLVGAAGVLLRGASGGGKSRLGDELVSQAALWGLFARHVADDRVILTCHAGRLCAEVPPPIAGRWERRGEGVARVEHEPRAVVRLIVDLRAGADIDRFPEAAARTERLCGVSVPRLELPHEDIPLAASRILGHLLRGGDASWSGSAV